MKLSFDIGTEDLMAFNRYWYDTDTAVRKRFFRVRLILAVLLVITGLLGWIKEGCWVSVVYFGLLAFLIVAFTPKFDKWLWLKQVRKQVEKPENAIWFGKRDMELEEGKVKVVFDKGDETVLWSAFIKSAETDAHFFLFQTSRQALIVPKRAMTEAQICELRELLNDKIKK